MIWVWIAAAVIISWLFCKKDISWYHYIWFLLPIEMYGVTIAGATLKPYMLFGVCIIVSDFIRNKTIRVPVTIIATVFALIFSDFLTGFVMASVMQHIMFILVLIIGFCYQHHQNNGIEFEEMGQATLATTIGYGIVFTVAWLMFSRGIALDGVYASERLEPGIVLRLASFGGNVSQRMRGFCIDPNSVITPLIPGAAYALANIVYYKQEIVKSILAITVYLAVVVYSGSRMALMCTFAMLTIFFIIGYKRANNKRLVLTVGVTILGILLMGLIANVDAVILEVAKTWASIFGERASLGSEYGRLTIWKTNIQYLIRNNKELFGVGQNQIYLLTERGLACHNTWLEWVCGTGIILGVAIDLWFILAPLKYKKRTIGLDDENAKNAIPLIMAYVIVVLCISTVDNITNSVLLFLMLILRYGTINQSIKKERVA